MNPIERVRRISNHLLSSSEQKYLYDSSSFQLNPCSTPSKPQPRLEENTTANDFVTIEMTDKKTGMVNRVQIPLYKGSIRAKDLSKLGLISYDPGYLVTASATSKISFIDGEQGILLYRGYPIEQLAEKSNFLEVSFLLINGELPTKHQLEHWTKRIMRHTYIHENLIQLMKTFSYDAHPMGMLISSIAALSTFYPEANSALQGEQVFQNAKLRNKQIFRIIGKLPTIAACAYRHRIGRPYNQPSELLSYTENFLNMLDRLSERNHYPNVVLSRALDQLFVLHAEHEMNCSSAAMRHLASSGTDPYTALAGAAGALYGPLHGGANQAVLQMLESIGKVENIPQFIENVKSKKQKLMGFGHRVYKNYDPRAKIIRRIAYEVFEVIGHEPLIEVATALEQHALKDDYFISRKLYPNVDFYSGIIYKAMGFPTDMFPVLFCIPRAVGWLAHWLELLEDPENKIVRPRQIYVGKQSRPYIPLEAREDAPYPTREFYSSIYNRRWAVAEKN